MDRSTYVPNEQRMYIALRYDESRITQRFLDEAIRGLLDKIAAELPTPGLTEAVDGYFDYSITPWDAAHPDAVVKYVGRVEGVQSLVPVKVIDQSTYGMEVWLDGEITQRGVERPADLLRNIDNPAFAAGMLQIRERPPRNRETPLDLAVIPRGWAEENVPPGTRLERQMVHYDPNAWEPLLELDWRCRTRLETGRRCHANATYHNPTVVRAGAAYLCAEHYEQRTAYRFQGGVKTVRVQEALDDPFYQERVRNQWLMRRCFDCGDEWANHYGELCPNGTGKWRGPEDLLGYTADDRPVYRGEPEEVALAYDPQGRPIRAEAPLDDPRPVELEAANAPLRNWWQEIEGVMHPRNVRPTQARAPGYEWTDMPAERPDREVFTGVRRVHIPWTAPIDGIRAAAGQDGPADDGGLDLWTAEEWQEELGDEDAELPRLVGGQPLTQDEIRDALLDLEDLRRELLGTEAADA